MSWFFNILGKASGNIAEVDTNSYLLTRGAQVNQRLGGETPVPNSVGAMRAFYEKDPGGYTGAPFLVSPDQSQDDRLKASLDTFEFSYVFNASAINSGVWRSNNNGPTVTFGTTGFALFSGGTSSAQGAVLSTSRYFPLWGNGGRHAETNIMLTGTLVAGQIFEYGFFPSQATVSQVPPDGVFFRLTSVGLYGVLSFGGTEQVSALLVPAASLAIMTNYELRLEVNARAVEFWLGGNSQDGLLVVMPIPSSLGNPMLGGSAPISYSYRLNAVVTPSYGVRVYGGHVDACDMLSGKPWSHCMAGQGLILYQGQDGGTMGSTALYANSANPTAAVPTNTTAALGTGLGGNFWSTNTLAVNTDGIISSYANPLGGVNQTPRNLVITGVKISTAVQTALANAGGAVYMWSLAFGGGGLSLATAEGVGSRAHRRIALGIQTAIGALVQGSQLTDIIVDLKDGPAVVYPGEYINTVMKNIGTVGTAGTLAHAITLIGYME